MKRFQYKAKAPNGKTVKGVVEANSDAQAVALLRERSLIVVKLSSGDVSALQEVSQGLLGKVSLSAKTNFTRQLATMISAGLNLVEALGILENQVEGNLGKIIADIRRHLEGGKSFSYALSMHEKVFDQVYISLVEAGEKAGVLDEVLLRLADTMEKQREFQAKVKGSLIYPAIIFFGMIGVMGVMVIYVIPQLSDLYESFEADLPWMTTFLISLSNFATTYWWIVLIMVVLAVLGWNMMMKRKEVKKKWETVLFSLPVFGELYQQILLTELTRTLSLLTHAGVPIVQALELVGKGQTNLNYYDGVMTSARMVEKGFSISQAFAQQEIFPSLMTQMLSVGEETGKVDEIMMRVSTYYESESEEKVKGLTTAVEPLILIMLGGGVGFLVFAIVMPIYNLTNTL